MPRYRVEMQPPTAASPRATWRNLQVRRPHPCATCASQIARLAHAQIFPAYAPADADRPQDIAPIYAHVHCPRPAARLATY